MSSLMEPVVALFGLSLFGLDLIVQLVPPRYSRRPCRFPPLLSLLRCGWQQLSTLVALGGGGGPLQLGWICLGLFGRDEGREGPRHR